LESEPDAEGGDKRQRDPFELRDHVHWWRKPRAWFKRLENASVRASTESAA